MKLDFFRYTDVIQHIADAVDRHKDTVGRPEYIITLFFVYLRVVSVMILKTLTKIELVQITGSQSLIRASNAFFDKVISPAVSIDCFLKTNSGLLSKTR
jgi:hypothetical protein